VYDKIRDMPSIKVPVSKNRLDADGEKPCELSNTIKNARMKLPLAFIVVLGLQASGYCEEPIGYKDAVLADKPFAYYRMGEKNSAEPVKDETSDDGGVYVNDPKVGTAGAIATDPKSTAVSFTRQQEQYIKLGNLGNFGSSLSSVFSIEYWLKTEDSSDHQSILGETNGPGFLTDFLVDIGEGNAKRFRILCRDDHRHWFQADHYPEGANIDIYDNSWHHIVHVYDPMANALNDQVLLYIDGVRQTLKVSLVRELPTCSDFNNPLTLGAVNRRGVVENYLEGSLDEVAFYLRPLSEAQIMSHYQAAGGAKKE
jgi:hypothetical protein